jgi:hypothetical protein
MFLLIVANISKIFYFSKICSLVPCVLLKLLIKYVIEIYIHKGQSILVKIY